MVADASDVLPTQAIIENFIHHNPLQAFESMRFDDAVEHVHEIERIKSPGARVYLMTNFDPRRRVKEALVELCAPFLDRGAAKWAPDFRHEGFLYFFAALEDLGRTPWRKHARETATRIMAELKDARATKDQDASLVLAEKILAENLECLGVAPERYGEMIRAKMLELRGWAGMFRRMETHPSEAPRDTKVRLIEFCAVQSILTRSSIEHFAAKHDGWSPTSMSLALWMSSAPTHSHSSHDAALHPSAIAFVNQESERRVELEEEFQRTLLHSVGLSVFDCYNIFEKIK